MPFRASRHPFHIAVIRYVQPFRASARCPWPARLCCACGIGRRHDDRPITGGRQTVGVFPLAIASSDMVRAWCRVALLSRPRPPGCGGPCSGVCCNGSIWRRQWPSYHRARHASTRPFRASRIWHPYITTLDHTVQTTSGIPAAVTKSTPDGLGSTWAAGTVTFSA